MLDETWELMDLLGLERERLHLKWISASEGAIFAAEIKNFVERVRQLGDCPVQAIPVLEAIPNCEPSIPAE